MAKAEMDDFTGSKEYTTGTVGTLLEEMHKKHPQVIFAQKDVGDAGGKKQYIVPVISNNPADASKAEKTMADYFASMTIPASRPFKAAGIFLIGNTAHQESGEEIENYNAMDAASRELRTKKSNLEHDKALLNEDSINQRQNEITILQEETTRLQKLNREFLKNRLGKSDDEHNNFERFEELTARLSDKKQDLELHKKTLSKEEIALREEEISDLKVEEGKARVINNEFAAKRSALSNHANHYISVEYEENEEGQGSLVIKDSLGFEGQGNPNYEQGIDFIKRGFEKAKALAASKTVTINPKDMAYQSDPTSCGAVSIFNLESGLEQSLVKENEALGITNNSAFNQLKFAAGASNLRRQQMGVLNREDLEASAPIIKVSEPAPQGSEDKSTAAESPSSNQDIESKVKRDQLAVAENFVEMVGLKENQSLDGVLDTIRKTGLLSKKDLETARIKLTEAVGSDQNGQCSLRLIKSVLSNTQFAKEQAVGNYQAEAKRTITGNIADLIKAQNLPPYEVSKIKPPTNTPGARQTDRSGLSRV